MNKYVYNQGRLMYRKREKDSIISFTEYLIKWKINEQIRIFKEYSTETIKEIELKFDEQTHEVTNVKIETEDK